MSESVPKPRLATSKKWTSLPAEMESSIANVVQQNFSSRLPQGRVIVETWIYSEELTLRIGFVEARSIRQINFEISSDYIAAKDKVLSLFYLLLDFAVSVFDDYLTATESPDGEELDLPRSWRPTEFERRQIYFQFSTFNSDLEKQADLLLGLGHRQLINETESEDSDPDFKELIKQRLGVSEKDDTDSGSGRKLH